MQSPRQWWGAPSEPCGHRWTETPTDLKGWHQSNRHTVAIARHAQQTIRMAEAALDGQSFIHQCPFPVSLLLSIPQRLDMTGATRQPLSQNVISDVDAATI
mmetsp:Transcript_38158/g.62136  ORF Transcript_38158/g.62136 Transcript_38158/m.62136 type:complete len:101 (-) Transcript_38158:1798-2100(-)